MRTLYLNIQSQSIKRRKTLKRIPIVALTFFTLLASVIVATGDSQTYNPPAERGEIYVVVRYRQGGMGGIVAQPTSLSVAWGAFRKSGSIRPPQVLPGRAIGAKGFVLKLRHTKNDSVGLTVSTDGRISQGPYQGRPPGEWNDGDYAHVEW